MARIPILQEDDPNLTPDQAACLAEAKQTRGKLLNVYRAMANRPEAARAFSNTVRALISRGWVTP